MQPICFFIIRINQNDGIPVNCVGAEVYAIGDGSQWLGLEADRHDAKVHF